MILTLLQFSPEAMALEAPISKQHTKEKRTASLIFGIILTSIHAIHRPSLRRDENHHISLTFLK
jgi:hypothetical protein